MTDWTEILIGLAVYVLVIYPLIKTIQLSREEARTVRKGHGTMPSVGEVIVIN